MRNAHFQPSWLTPNKGNPTLSDAFQIWGNNLRRFEELFIGKGILCVKIELCLSPFCFSIFLDTRTHNITISYYYIHTNTHTLFFSQKHTRECQVHHTRVRGVQVRGIDISTSPLPVNGLPTVKVRVRGRKSDEKRERESAHLMLPPLSSQNKSARNSVMSSSTGHWNEREEIVCVREKERERERETWNRMPYRYVMEQ